MCAAEAPGVEQFARDNADKIQVIGIGTQDSQAEAVDFVDQHDVGSFPMLWDPSSQTWTQLALSGQPAWMVIAPDGKLTSTGGYGGIDETQAVRLADAFAVEFGSVSQ